MYKFMYQVPYLEMQAQTHITWRVAMRKCAWPVVTRVRDRPVPPGLQYIWHAASSRSDRSLLMPVATAPLYNTRYMIIRVNNHRNSVVFQHDDVNNHRNLQDV